MQSVALSERALESLHALRMEPFLAIIAVHPIAFCPTQNCFVYTVPAAAAVSRLLSRGHLQSAVALRDKEVRNVVIEYFGNKANVLVDIEMPDSSFVREPAAAVSNDVCLAIVSTFIPEIRQAVAQSDRYVRAFSKTVFVTPDRLLNTIRDGVTYRVITDVPRIDSELLTAMDLAMSRTSSQVVTLRVTITGKNRPSVDHIEPALVVDRSQPLRPLAALALGRAIHSTFSHHPT